MLSVGGSEPRDILEYLEMTDGEEILLEMSRAGERRNVRICKREGETLGLVLGSAVFRGTMLCRNHCRFCFVDQLPSGLRESLYEKDDDYRLSFLEGSFITLTNLGRSDRSRILERRPSPLYVSLQAAEPALRREIFGNRRAAGSLKFLAQMLEAGLEIHLQVVVCPGINDGPALRRTLELVGERYSAAASLGLVPVGFTRWGPDDMRRVGRREAQDILDLAHDFSERLHASEGRRLVFASDELYLLAGEGFPPEDAYEGYPQLANGIGLARKLIEEARRAARRIRPAARPGTAAVTGMAGAVVLEQALVAAGLDEATARSSLMPVTNGLFGAEVTVSGLLAGADIASACLAETRPIRRLLVPVCMLRGDAFIDDMSLDELREATGAEVLVLPVDGASLLAGLAAEETA